MSKTIAERMARVRRAARRGAASASRHRQIVDYAVEVAVYRWQDAVLRKKHLTDEEGWACRVAANAARRLGAGKRRVVALSAEIDASEGGSLVRQVPAVPLDGALRLERHLEKLTSHQRQIVEVLMRSGMTLHLAAKELGMDRANLRRAFNAAIRRLESNKTRPPPPPSGVCKLFS